LNGDFGESDGDVVHYIKAGNFLTVGRIIMEEPSQDMRGKEGE
jgi:hypothetical protein